MSNTKSAPNRDARVFGGLIAARRRRLGLSQSELGNMIGISQESLSRLESGLASPKFVRLGALAEALECSVSDLFLDISESEKDKGRIFAELIHPLSPEWQDAILKTATTMVRLVRKAGEGKSEADEEEPGEQAFDSPGKVNCSKREAPWLP